jgi:hypothetical protein
MNGYPPQPPYPYQTPPRRSGGGSCFLKGCLVLVIVVMLCGVVLGGIGYYLYRSAQPFLTRQQVALPVLRNSDAVYDSTTRKLAAFNQSLATGQRAVLTLTADDLNALVAHDPQLAKYEGKLYFSIVNNQLCVETSFPLTDESGLRADQRAYFNARFVLDASYSSGDFAFLLSRIESLDRHQPSAFLGGFLRGYFGAISQAFNRSFHDHPERYGQLQQLTSQIHTIILQNNQIVATSVDHPRAMAAPVAIPAGGP